MYAVFDTNFYRKLVAKRDLKSDLLPLMEEIRIAEQTKNIKPLISATVAQELISHLLDEGNGDSCTKAGIALYKHCGNDAFYNMLPLPEVQVARDYFGIANYPSVLNQKIAARILYDLTQNIESALKTHKEQIIQIRNYITSVEKELADTVEQIFKTDMPEFEFGMTPFKKK